MSEVNLFQEIESLKGETNIFLQRVIKNWNTIEAMHAKIIEQYEKKIQELTDPKKYNLKADGTQNAMSPEYIAHTTPAKKK